MSALPSHPRTRDNVGRAVPRSRVTMPGVCLLGSGTSLSKAKGAPSKRLQAASTWLLALGLLLAVVAGAVAEENWPQWRGPEGTGASRQTGLPVTWSETENVVWKCRLPEWGNNTPAVWNDALFLTSHVDDARLVLVRIDRASGRIVWTREVGQGAAPRLKEQSKKGPQRRHQAFHDTHNLASPSVVTDGALVVAHFGNGDLAAYDFQGNRLWHRNLQKDHGDYTVWWGHANSPVLCGDLVISICLQDACRDLPGEPSPSYVVAHDKRTGRQVWKTLRVSTAEAEFADSYTTPILRRSAGRTELVVMGGEMLDAYDPASGRRLWFLLGLSGNRTVTGPVALDDLVVATQGRRGPMLAVRPRGWGERSEEDVVWRHERGTPDTPWPAVADGRLFFINDDGIAKCLDARTGKLQWQERLGGGPYRASPLVADGRVYFLNTTGMTTVVGASDTFRRLARNQIDDDTLASPAASAGRLYLRGRKWLYCVGAQ